MLAGRGVGCIEQKYPCQATRRNARPAAGLIPPAGLLQVL